MNFTLSERPTLKSSLSYHCHVFMSPDSTSTATFTHCKDSKPRHRLQGVVFRLQHQLSIIRSSPWQTMPSVTAKCCASLRRFLRFLVGAPGAPRAPSPPASIVEAPASIVEAVAEAPAEVPLPAPEEVLAPPAPALTLLQQQFDLAANAARNLGCSLVRPLNLSQLSAFFCLF